MTLDKGCFVKDITDGRPVSGIFLVKNMILAETKAGKPYLSLVLMDNSGEIAARVWDRATELAPSCAAGSYVNINGIAQAYKEVVQVKINTLAALAGEEIETAHFWPTTSRDRKTMSAELTTAINSIADPHLCRLLTAIFTDPAISDAFQRAPAAKNMHHAYLGGLLEHTLAVTHLAEQICRLYPELDRSLLLAGALLHDIGKLKEFCYDQLPYDYTDSGRLAGHLVLGAEMVQEKINTLSDFPPQTAMLLKHLIVSHHGQLEFGSPTEPMTREAFVLNLLDDLDAKMNFFTRLSDSLPDAGYHWSDFQRMFGRFLYLRRTTADQQTAAPSAPSCPAQNQAKKPAKTRADDRQPSLF